MKPYRKSNHKGLITLKISLFITLILLTVATLLFMWNIFSWGSISKSDPYIANLGIWNITFNKNSGEKLSWSVSTFSWAITAICVALVIIYGVLSLRYALIYAQPGRASMMYSWIIFLLSFIIMIILAYEVSAPDTVENNYSFFHFYHNNGDISFELNWVAYTTIAIFGTLEFSGLIAGIIGSIKMISK